RFLHRGDGSDPGPLALAVDAHLGGVHAGPVAQDAPGDQVVLGHGRIVAAGGAVGVHSFGRYQHVHPGTGQGGGLLVEVLVAARAGTVHVQHAGAFSRRVHRVGQGGLDGGAIELDVEGLLVDLVGAHRVGDRVRADRNIGG